jgi:hypothetical protein
MNLKDAEQCIRDVWGKDTKVFAREDFISGNKKVLRPLEPGEDPKLLGLTGRVLRGENLLILGQGKTWEEALRGPISEVMNARREAARLRAEHANHEGEMFSLFLRERFDAEFTEWRNNSELGKAHQAAFEKRMKEAQSGEVPGAPSA